MVCRFIVCGVLFIALTIDAQAQFFDVFQRNPLNIQHYDSRIQNTRTSHNVIIRTKPVSPVTYTTERNNNGNRKQTAHTTHAAPKVVHNQRVITQNKNTEQKLQASRYELSEPSDSEDRIVTSRKLNTDNIYVNNRRTTTRPIYQDPEVYQTENRQPDENYNNYYNYQIENSNRRTTKVQPINNYIYTTYNPFNNPPGVKPATIQNHTPFTNKPIVRPVTVRPKPRPNADPDALLFPEDPGASEIIIGHDEDFMSDVEKRRHIEIAERMCDKYKSMMTKQLQAIPLLPNPDPVEVNVSTCSASSVPLVLGGKVVTINEYPHMALLGWMKVQDGGYSWRCGGSLVSDQFILTAAHCSSVDRDNTVYTGPPSAVQLGSSTLDDPGALVVKVTVVIKHPKYKPPKSYYDLALVKLAKRVKFSEVVRPACLGNPPPTGRTIIATGWGKTEFGSQSVELRSVALTVWSIEECAAALGTSKKFPRGPEPSSQMCAGERAGGKDTCQGDSGGPAQVQDGCLWRVVAVTSLGRGCGAPNTPGMYAIAHKAFIASHVFANIREVKDDYNKNDNYDNNNNNYNTNNNDYNINNNNYNINNRNNNYNKSNVNNNNYKQIYENNYTKKVADDRPQSTHTTHRPNNRQTDNRNSEINYNLQSGINDNNNNYYKGFIW